MRNLTKQLLACVVCIVVTTPALATNGYFAHGYGTKNKALAGAGVALPQDAMIAATNPAGMVWVGDRMDLGLAMFSPSPRSYEATTPGGAAQFPLAPEKVESDSDYFFIPHFAKNWVYDANSTMGITVYGNGGMNTDYPGSAAGGAGTFGAGAAGVNLEQLFINGSYSRKLNATNSFGVSLVFAYQRFKATGLNSFAAFNLSNDGANLSNNGTDTSTGFGFKLGWQGEVTPELALAASYQSEMQMSEFDKYKGLFAEQGGFNIPATWTIGLAYSLPNKSKVVLDVQKIMYSDIKSIGNPLMPALGNCFAANGGTGAPSSSCLGGDNGPGFGWEDMTIVKIGYQWAMASMPGWTWRAGYSKGDQPIPDSEVLFNILAPGVMEQHLTFGFTKELSGNREFNFAFMYAPENDITGPNPLGDGQQVTLKMRQWEIEGSYSW